MRSRRSCRSPDTAVCHLMRSNLVMRLMPSTMVYNTANLATSAFSLPASRSKTGAHRQTHDRVGNGGCRRPGETEPMGREDHGKNGEGRVVGREDEALEPSGDDPGRDQGNVHGAEEEQPPPCRGPVRQEPMVHKAVEHPQQHGNR